MNKSSTKKCQNCEVTFEIEKEDVNFYAKISVPPPTWCPTCRAMRRMTWRNERTLYKTTCAATGKPLVSMFAPDSGVVVYDRDHWWSDAWDQLESGQEYDWEKPFFLQFRELLSHAPLPNLANTNVVLSDYGNHNADLKNCYLTFASFDSENVHYSQGAVQCKDSMDLYTVEWGERCYEVVLCGALSRACFAYDCDDSVDSRFIRSSRGLTDCLGCINLRNKSNHIFNEPLSKEGYKKEVSRYDLGSYKHFESFKARYEEFIAHYPRRHAAIIKSRDCTGDNIMNSKNCRHCFDIYDGVEDVKFVAHAMNLKDSYDSYGGGAGAELMYEFVDTGINAQRCKFNIYTHTCHDAQYTYACHNSSHLFGCVGLRSKEYCILNKQYTKDEYNRLVPEIMNHMNDTSYQDRKGKVYGYGEFFPPELSPFAYNETIAQEYFPLSKAEAESKSYRWKTPAKRHHEPTVRAEDLPDHIKDAGENIPEEVIECLHKGTCKDQCTFAFRVIPEEFAFYRAMNLPLPRLCPNCRHHARLAQRNPLQLWKRKCMCAGTKDDGSVYKNIERHVHGEDHCPNEFQTSYAPKRPEVVYCESCYQAEVA